MIVEDGNGITYESNRITRLKKSLKISTILVYEHQKYIYSLYFIYFSIIKTSEEKH